MNEQLKKISTLVLTAILAAGSIALPLPQIAYAATNTETITASQTWTAPAGVTSVSAECWGTGGSGGGSTSSTLGGTGGGAGAYAKTASVAVTPGTGYTLTIGAVGSNAAGAAGGSGGDTSFTGNSSQKCLAKGGGGGATNGGTAGAGGLASASTGDTATKFNGGSGWKNTSTSGGGGGSSGGTASAGNTATSVTGATAVTGGGDGGNGGAPKSNGSAPTTPPGGGGGGGGCKSKGSGCSGTGTNSSGAVGALGQVALTYTVYTVLGDATDPSNTTLNPGDPATMADAFTFQTSITTDVVTAVVVGLGTGASNGISLVEITDSAGTTVYGSVSNPSSDTPSITLSTNTLTANTTLTTYKIRITPKSTVTGGPYTVNAKINSYTSTNVQTGSDVAGTTITINNGAAVTAPIVATVFANRIGFNSANLVGSITDNGGADATQTGFAYGTDPTLATVIATTTLGGFTGTGSFNDTVGGLSQNLTYYFRAYATNTGGTSYGSILSFTTGDSTPSRMMRLFEGFILKLFSGKIVLFGS